jgi:hypothetical protein
MPEESEQAEKRRVLANDRSVREQQQKAAATYFAFGAAEADEPRGRFKNTGGATTVIGATPLPQYPELPTNSPWHHDPVPPEEPLGFGIDEMVPLEPPTVGLAVGTDGSTSDAPPEAASPQLSERDVGPSSSREQGDDAAE